MSGNAVKFLVLPMFFLSLSLPAQDKPAAAAGTPGCGEDGIKFSVKTGSGPSTLQPQSGKALVVFIEDDSNFNSVPRPTTRAGVDGSWMGATHGNSWFAFSVDPGVHHLCASWQTTVVLGKGHKTAAAHFNADAGGVYYFAVRNTFLKSEFAETTDISLVPLDSDEGQLLANKFAMSASQPRK